MTRRIAIALIIVGLGMFLAVRTSGDPTFVPDEWVPWIIFIKGLFATIGVIGLLWHMDRSWSSITAPDQRIRYLTLLAYGVLQTGASTEQFADEAPLEWRYLGGLMVSILFLWATFVSIRRSLQESDERR